MEIRRGDTDGSVKLRRFRLLAVKWTCLLPSDSKKLTEKTRVHLNFWFVYIVGVHATSA